MISRIGADLASEHPVDPGRVAEDHRQQDRHADQHQGKRVVLVVLAIGLARRSHGWPHLGATLVFLSGYIGLAAGFFPDIVPYDMTFRQAANQDNALALMLVGVAILLPVILGYTAWVYWVFRGKVSADAGYH